MFGYLRLFSLVSFLAILCIAFLVGMYLRSIAAGDLKTLAQQQHLAIAQGYNATLWSGYGRELSAARGGDAGVTSAMVDKFRADTVRYFNAVSVLGAAVYLSPTTMLAATDHWQAVDNAAAGGLITASLSGKPDAPEVISEPQTPDHPARMVLRSAFPLGDPARPSAYISMVSDLSPQWKKLNLFQWVSFGSIVTVFVVLIWILVITSKKAEEIITQQHEANTELAAAAAAAKAETQQKSQFLANISHELRTPLNAIIGFSEIIKNELMGEVQNQRYHDYVNDIHSSGVHLLSLINDILDFSKAEAGKLEMEISEVNATKLISNCLRLVSPRAESANVELMDAMPKEPFVMTTDSKKLKQVMLNLLSNAVKFTPTGGQVRVTAWRNVQDDSFSFEVKDTGIGIAPKDIARAMSPFGQVDNALSRKYEGTGLGLPLTRKFVELMGGTFHIGSEPGAGTTITFTLPREFRATGEVPVKML